MNSRSYNTISSICSGQTVITLLLTYLILLLYIIPTAYHEALELSGMDSATLSYIKFCRIGLLSEFGYLNDDFRSIYISTELTAGIFEDLSLFGFMLAFQIFIQKRLTASSEPYQAMIGLAVIAFVADLSQTLLSTYLVGSVHESSFMIYAVLFLAIAKIMIYSYLIYSALRSWIPSFYKA